jgi:hypothetical protein
MGGNRADSRGLPKLRKSSANREVPVHLTPLPVTYFVGAPHPPSERRTDAGQLPPWLLGVAMWWPLRYGRKSE